MRKGFTLLEVMVAMAILASAMLAVSQIVSGALRNHERARDLNLATLLARGKMVDLEEKYRAEGFRDGDETDEGTFEEEGHPEFRWKAEAIAPKVDELCTRLLGELLPDAEAELEDADEPIQGANTMGLAAGGVLQQQCATFVQDLQKGVREVRLTVTWGPQARPESFTVVTHLVEPAPTELVR